MNQTTNYNFNVPVGSDIVNPLVQDFPNWESLDTILRNVANTGITTATHTKTGTIHTLTFSETTVPMIRFQATADFNTNDTFTVNGVSVSALTVTGEALPAGAFVIGSMVLCELRDNLLTVYSSGTDANTLQGHPASYFATDSDLQTVDGKADANKVLIDQISDDLSDVMNKNKSFTVHNMANIANPSVISVATASLIEYKYIPLCRINAQFTLSSTRPASSSLFTFDGIAPSAISAIGNITDVNGASVSRFLLGNTGNTDGSGNRYLQNLSTLPAGTYYISAVCSLE